MNRCLTVPSILMAIASLMAFDAAPALASCPVDLNFEAIKTAIHQADTCTKGIAIARQCAFGSSADVAFVTAASEPCLADMAPLKGDRQAALDDLLGQCSDKYADFDGTLYRSFAAFCQLEVIEGFHSALSDPVGVSF